MQKESGFFSTVIFIGIIFGVLYLILLALDHSLTKEEQRLPEVRQENVKRQALANKLHAEYYNRSR